jgi:hypothetical protein
MFDVNHSHFLKSPFAVMTMMIRPLLLFLCHIVFVIVVDAVPDFDPYGMNGGLVSAVAGRDFVVVALVPIVQYLVPPPRFVPIVDHGR